MVDDGVESMNGGYKTMRDMKEVEIMMKIREDRTVMNIREDQTVMNISEAKKDDEAIILVLNS